MFSLAATTLALLGPGVHPEGARHRVAGRHRSRPWRLVWRLHCEPAWGSGSGSATPTNARSARRTASAPGEDDRTPTGVVTVLLTGIVSPAENVAATDPDRVPSGMLTELELIVEPETSRPMAAGESEAPLAARTMSVFDNAVEAGPRSCRGARTRAAWSTDSGTHPQRVSLPARRSGWTATCTVQP